MTRREKLKLCALGAVLAAWPAVSRGTPGSSPLIYDGRFEKARNFAQGRTIAHDCRIDAAALWYRSFAGNAHLVSSIDGLTSAADALILADCARREGMRFEQLGQASGQLVAWQITSKARV